jgi:tetratricopeptide (TPR) repeat protein
LAEVAPLSRDKLDKYVAHHKRRAGTDQDSADSHVSLGLCYLQLKLYDNARKCFEAALEQAPEHADSYYYAALAILKGRRPRVLPATEIAKIEEYVEAASQLNEDDAKYDCLSAIVRRDYYRTNGLRVPVPDEYELLARAKKKSCEPNELQQLVRFIPIRDEMLIASILA